MKISIILIALPLYITTNVQAQDVECELVNGDLEAEVGWNWNYIETDHVDGNWYTYSIAPHLWRKESEGVNNSIGALIKSSQKIAGGRLEIGSLYGDYNFVKGHPYTVNFQYKYSFYTSASACHQLGMKAYLRTFASNSFTNGWPDLSEDQIMERLELNELLIHEYQLYNSSPFVLDANKSIISFNAVADVPPSNVGTCSTTRVQLHIDEIEINDLCYSNTSQYYQNTNNLPSHQGDYINFIKMGEDVIPTEKVVVPTGPVTVQTNEPVVMEALNSITLKPGFRAPHGSNLKLSIINNCAESSGCQAPQLRSAENVDVQGGGTEQTSIDDLRILENDISIYPNPSNGNFTVTGYFSDHIEHLELKVYNSSGILVLTKHQENVNLVDLSIDVSSFGTGLYLVQVFTKNETFSKRMIVEKN